MIPERMLEILLPVFEKDQRKIKTLISKDAPPAVFNCLISMHDRNNIFLKEQLLEKLKDVYCNGANLKRDMTVELVIRFDEVVLRRIFIPELYAWTKEIIVL